MEVTVFGRKGCSYCDKAVAYLDRLNIEHTYIDVNEDFEAALDLAKTFGQYKTVPQIVIDNELIGGYTELTEKVM